MKKINEEQLDSKKVLAGIKKFQKLFGTKAPLDVRKYPKSIGTTATVYLPRGLEFGTPDQVKKHKQMQKIIKALKLPISKLDSVRGEARFWVQYGVDESVNEAKNPFKKGDKVIVDKIVGMTHARQSDAKRFNGKKGTVIGTQGNHVSVKLKGFRSPDIEFATHELKLDESVNEGFEKSAIQQALKANGYNLKQKDVKIGVKKKSGGLILYYLNGAVIGSNDYGYKDLIKYATDAIKKDPKEYGLEESVKEEPNIKELRSTIRSMVQDIINKTR